jgi:ATP-binding cassette subfamily E protein 1
MQCIDYCPRVRTGDETIVLGDNGKPIISEELCSGCGICVHKCPFDAIRIIGLPQELKEDLVHQFGKNGFRLYRLPCPTEKKVIGLLGPNGIGKTTVINILSGQQIPNMGDYEAKPAWDNVLERFSGTELYDYLKKLSDNEIRTSLKPQYVDKLPVAYKGKVKTLLKRIDERNRLDEVSDELNIKNCLDHDIKKLSGGELQRVAIAACMLKDADMYFFDEPSSYLDIYQRLKIANTIQKLSETEHVMVIEHDLAVLDFLADNVHLMYGAERAYGILAQPRAVRTAINTYLHGFLKEENIRFRKREITFESHPPKQEWLAAPLIHFDALQKRFKGFKLEVKEGAIRKGEVVGVVGPNATGKTTFVKMLAGVIAPTKGKIEQEIKVSYKPQYIKSDFKGTVEELFLTRTEEKHESSFFTSEIIRPLKLKTLLTRGVQTLSGGELQSVAIALSLMLEADLYLIDEPSAYLDSNVRMEAAKAIRRVIEKRGKSAMIVDHDIYFIDLIADSIMVFSGEAAKHGFAQGPMRMREGMNLFLKDVNITFRRDKETRRPRINKLNSKLDREQKGKGEYYYSL